MQKLVIWFKTKVTNKTEFTNMAKQYHSMLSILAGQIRKE